MKSSLAERSKNMIADLLTYYGMNARVDYHLPFNSEPIDVAGTLKGEDYPKVAVFCQPDQERLKSIFHLAKHSSIEDVVILGNSTEESSRKKAPESLKFFEFPDIDHTDFEKFIEKLTMAKRDIPYFNTVPREDKSDPEKQDCIMRFEYLVKEQGLDLERARHEIYRTAISGLNIRYGRYIQLEEGNPRFERNKELSREAILLKAAGYLKEEKLPDRGLGLDSDGNSFLVLSDSEETGKLAEAVVDDFVYANMKVIRKIISDYPPLFNYFALVGSLGYFAPKTSLSIERHRRSWSGIIRATAQSENSSLVEVIRTMINTVGISEELWNRINCLVSFPELNNLLTGYFEKFEKAGVGVSGYRGLKRIYLPVKRIVSNLNLTEVVEKINEKDLEEFCIYDSIIRSNKTGFDFRRVVIDLGLDQRKLIQRINELAKLGYCSKLLPEDADLPIAIYNQNKFDNYCLKIMREKASELLDIEW